MTREARSRTPTNMPQEEPSAIGKPALGPRILVVDHEEDVRCALCDRLSYLGFDVAAEDNAVSGLSRVARDGDRPFHGMLVELHMPTGDGLAVVQEMQARFPSVAVMVMGEAQHLGKLRRAVQLGAREYLVKPFDMELLRRKCEAVFRGHARMA